VTVQVQAIINMIQPALLTTIETETAPSPTASIIWMHGLGASGHDFAGIIPALDLPAGLAIRFIFPHAPQQAVSINNGLVMPAWYDIRSDRFDDNEDTAGIRTSSQAIIRLIQQEHERGITSNRIILAGFSQGGAIALHCGLHYPQRLAGIIALSTYLPQADGLPGLSKTSPPILMMHGNADPIVPLALAEQSQQQLSVAGYDIDWHCYPMEHNVCAEEISEIGRWISLHLGQVS